MAIHINNDMNNTRMLVTHGFADEKHRDIVLHSQDKVAPRVFDEVTGKGIIERIKSLVDPDFEMSVSVQSWWGGSQKWARNRATMTSDQRDVHVHLTMRSGRGGSREVNFNQTDDDSLESVVTFMKAIIKNGRVRGNDRMWVESPVFPVGYPRKGKSVWSDATFDRKAEENGRIVHDLTQMSESKGLLSAGFIGTIGARISSYERISQAGESYKYGEATEVQCSCTVRSPQGTGSGWGGNSSFDLQRVDMKKIAEIAYDKCMRGLDPVRIEPGRYQVILEPQATAEFAKLLVLALSNRTAAEVGGSELTLGFDQALSRWRNKLGLQVVDSRINLHHDPEDVLNGTHPEHGMNKVVLIGNGILKTISTDFKYAARELHRTKFDLFRSSFILDGGNASVENMISTMERGLIVTRLSGVAPIHNDLMTGLTRDGLWLVEGGKITKAVRNFRFTESPWFIFNNVVEIGESVPVFSPGRWKFPFGGGYQNVVQSVVVPAMKINDFSFTSTIDAI